MKGGHTALTDTTMNLNRPFTLVTLALLAQAAMAQTTFENGALSIVTAAADDVFTVVVGPVNGEVTLFNVPGVPDGTVYTGVTSIFADTQAGNDQVRVTAQGTQFPSIRIETGAGEDVASVDKQVFFTTNAVTSRIALSGGAGSDSFLINGTSAARDFRTKWDVQGGEGANSTNLLVDSQDVSTTMTLDVNVVGGESNDDVKLDVIARPTILNLVLGGQLGAGSDTYEINSTTGGNTVVGLRSFLTTGIGDDKFVGNFLLNQSVGLSGLIDTGDGKDVMELYFARDLRGTGRISSLGGDDAIKVLTDGTVIGSPLITAGDGNDIVEFYASALTGDPLSDGGPGTDQFFGVGRRINFEN